MAYGTIEIQLLLLLLLLLWSFMQEFFILDSSGKEIFTEVSEEHVSSTESLAVFRQQEQCVVCIDYLHSPKKQQMANTREK